MSQGWLVADQWHGSIILEVFGRVGLGVSKLCNFELVGVGEKHRWSDDGVDIFLQNLVHHLQFSDVPLEVRRIGQARG